MPKSDQRRIYFNDISTVSYGRWLPKLHETDGIKKFSDRLSATGLAPKAVIGAAIHKLAHLIYRATK